MRNVRTSVCLLGLKGNMIVFQVLCPSDCKSPLSAPTLLLPLSLRLESVEGTASGRLRVAAALLCILVATCCSQLLRDRREPAGTGGNRPLLLLNTGSQVLVCTGHAPDSGVPPCRAGLLRSTPH